MKSENNETYEIPFTVGCLAVYKSKLDIPKDIVLNKDKNVLLNYIRDHLSDASVDELEWTDDLSPDEAVRMEDIRSYVVDEQLKQEKRLKETLILAGIPAIETFLGRKIEYTTDAYISCSIDDEIKQMPDDTYAKYVKYYLDEEVVS